MGMTKAQQMATRKLAEAEQDYLWAYHWQLVSPGKWRHPRVNVSMGRQDAVLWTKNHPEIGW